MRLEIMRGLFLIIHCKELILLLKLFIYKILTQNSSENVLLLANNLKNIISVNKFTIE